MEKSTKYLALFLLIAIVSVGSILTYRWYESEQKEEQSLESSFENNKKAQEDSTTTKTDSTTISTTSSTTTSSTSDIDTSNLSPSSELVKLYYQRLVEGKLQEAFDMKKYKTTSFSVFEGWYKNLKESKFLDFIEVAPNQYDFLVELTNEDGSKEKYHVWMQAEGNLLNTISSVETDDTAEARIAYSEEGDLNTLFLITNGTKTKIASTKHSKKEEFNNVSISSDHAYLTYFTRGYEWNGGKVYDIAQKKEVHSIDAAEITGFTWDMKHFYQCQSSGMLAGDVSTYSVPSFKLEKDLDENKTVYDCKGYESKTNTLKYTLSLTQKPAFTNNHTYIYDFPTGTVKETN